MNNILIDTHLNIGLKSNFYSVPGRWATYSISIDLPLYVRTSFLGYPGCGSCPIEKYISIGSYASTKLLLYISMY